MYDITRLRQQEFPSTHEILYFNSADIALLPLRTRDRMAWSLAGMAEHPDRFMQQHGLPMWTEFQRRVAALVHAADPAEIAFVSSTALGFHLLAQAISWQPGDNIILGNLEFPVNVQPWLTLQRAGVELRQVAAGSGGLTTAALAGAVDGRTRLVAASTVQFFSGHRTDLQAVGDFCAARDTLFFVDASQSIGHIPIDVQALRVDAVVAGSQQSLLAAPGSGFLYLRAGLAERLQLQAIRGGAAQGFTHRSDDDRSPPAAGWFNLGMINISGLFGITESIGLLHELDLAQVDQHTTGLAAAAIARLTELGYAVMTPAERHGAIVTFRPAPSADGTADLFAYLAEHNTAVSKQFDAAGTPHVRLSFHCYNTHEELDRFLQLLQSWRP